MSADLTTTNVFLGIMAAVGLLQVAAVAAAAVAGYVIYRRVLSVLNGLEERQVAPAVARVNAILDDVKGVTSTVKKETGHLERLVEWLVEGVSRKRRRASAEEASSRVM
jgi:hypothetical protein